MNVFYSRLGKYIFALFNDTKNKHHFWVCRSTPLLWLNVGKNQYHHHKVWIFKIFPKRNLSSKCVFLKVKNCKKKFQTFQRKFWKALLICNAIGECFQEDMYLGLGLYVSHFSIEWKLILEGGGEVGSERGEHHNGCAKLDYVGPCWIWLLAKTTKADPIKAKRTTY